MYSQKVTQENLEKFAAHEGWMPVPRTVKEVEELIAEVDSMVQIESNRWNTYVSLVKTISQRRQQEIRRFIENEQVLCALDSNYWESRYAYVCDMNGSIVKFANRRSQEVIDSIFAEAEEEERSTELLFLGARQTGIQTKILLKLMHRLLFVPKTQFLAAGVETIKPKLLERILDTAYNRCPWWLVPQKMPKSAFNNGSILSIQSGMRATGIAQGWTPNCIFLCDIDLMPHPKKVIEEGLLPAVHSSRYLFLVLHGGSGTKSEWLRETWRQSKEFWPQGRYRLRPIFLPWAICTDIYPEPDWLKRYPIPDGWKPMQETVEHRIRCEKFIRATSYLSKIAGEQWSMPASQQWFWEYGYKEAEARQVLPEYLLQMAADDEEVFYEETDDIESIFPAPVAMQEKVARLSIAGESKRHADED